MQTTITLKRLASCWVACWSGDGADEIRELFGVTEIPTAYTGDAEPSTVLRGISQLNPGADVRLNG